MKTMQKNIDIHAHIEDLQCTVHTESGFTSAKISFRNLGYGEITAIKFNARGYNAFNDAILINGKEDFSLVIQDFKLPKNEYSTTFTAHLPNPEIKKLRLEESQICYSDDSVISYPGSENITIDLEEIDDPYVLKAIDKIHSVQIKYRAKNFKQGWLCTCGRFNPHTNDTCSLCSNAKDDILYITSKESLEKAAKMLHELEENDRIQAAQQKEIQTKKRIKIGVCLAVCTALATASTVFISNRIKISKRETYSSAEKMSEEMQGSWVYYDSNSKEILCQIEIKGDQYVKTYEYLKQPESGDVTWNPKKGSFKIGDSTVAVNKGGETLTEESSEKVHEYKRGKIKSKLDEYFSDFESGYSALQITEFPYDPALSDELCTGTVENTGTDTYKFVQITAEYKDFNGNVIDTRIAYIKSDELGPGKSSAFEMYVPENDAIVDCSVSITNWF